MSDELRRTKEKHDEKLRQLNNERLALEEDNKKRIEQMNDKMQQSSSQAYKERLNLEENFKQKELEL